MEQLLLFIFLFLSLCSQSSAKECTNIPTQLSSHTIRAQLLASGVETVTHYHLTPTDESAWMDLLPKKLATNKDQSTTSVEEFDWAMLYRSLKGSADEVRTWLQGGGDFLREVSLHDVQLDPDSMHGRAQQTNLEYLLLLDVDNLVWSFRKQAGLPTQGTPYGGWEAPNVELRGHFVGHYMSASAQMWASTHNDTLYQKMTAVVDALYECQKKMGTGYLSAFPSEFFDRFEAIKSVWAPYYTIHKIMSGLLDQYSFADNDQALQMVVWMADYFSNRVKNVIQAYTIERHWQSLNEETGGMNDVLYRLYTITGDQKHLILAHLFDKPCFLGLLAVQADSLSGFHANTHIPVVVGAQMRYEVTGDTLYKDIATFFMDIVNSSHSYATGGTSVSEFWSDPKRIADSLTTEDEESCTTYNMLKVSRNLFRWTKEIAYADHYERALTNGVLSIQRGREPGVMIYMLPLGRGQSKARSYHGWGTKYDSFWCCYGTGIESFSKLGDSIYFEEKGSTPGLYIIQFIPNTFRWKSAGIEINMKTLPVSSWNPSLQVSLTISSQSTTSASTLNIRIPSWTTPGAKAQLNSQDLEVPNQGTFLTVSKQWGSNDVLNLQLPIGLKTEAIKDDRPEFASLQAVLFGPYLLAGLTDGDWDLMNMNSNSISDSITAIPAEYNSQLITLTQDSNNETLVLSTSNGSFAMQQWPEDGTDAAAHATFRKITQNSRTLRAVPRRKAAKQSLTLEPLHLPGMGIVDQGANNNLAISSSQEANSVFHMIPGLNGKPNTISLESESHPGCFVYNGGKSVQLMCQEKSLTDTSFADAASFNVIGGIRQYNDISFIAKGVRRNFLLEPLFSLRDESYTVYFNIGA